MTTFNTRAEWDAYQGERQKYYMGRDMPPWRLATGRERIGIIFFHAVTWGVVAPALLLAMVWVIGTASDSFVRHKAEYERCLKQATNGYEIKQCR